VNFTFDASRSGSDDTLAAAPSAVEELRRSQLPARVYRVSAGAPGCCLKCTRLAQNLGQL
jgi:hypothetical protein